MTGLVGREDQRRKYGYRWGTGWGPCLEIWRRANTLHQIWRRTNECRSPCAKFAVGLCVVRQIWSLGPAKNEIWLLGREYRDLVTELPQKRAPVTKFRDRALIPSVIPDYQRRRSPKGPLCRLLRDLHRQRSVEAAYTFASLLLPRACSGSPSSISVIRATQSLTVIRSRIVP